MPRWDLKQSRPADASSPRGPADELAAAEPPPKLLGSWPRAHEPHTMLHAVPGLQIGRTYGVEKLIPYGPDRLISAGSDGACRVWHIRRGHSHAQS